MIKFLKNLFNKDDEEFHNKQFYIDLIQYNYIVTEIYNNMIFVDVDIDTCDVKKGEHVKLMNEMYTLVNTEFFAEKSSYRWRLVLVQE